MVEKLLFEIQIDQKEANKRLAAYTGSLSSLRTERSALSKQLKELQKDEKANAAEIAKVSTQLVRVNTEIKTTSKEYRQLEKEAQTTTGSLDAQRNQLVRMKQAHKNLTPGINTTKEEYEKLGREVLSLNKDLKEQEGSLGDFQRNVGDYTGSIKDALKSAVPGIGNISSMFSKAGPWALVLGGLAAGTAAVAKFALELGRLRDKAEIATGETGAQLDGLTASAQSLAETYEELDFTEVLKNNRVAAELFNESQEEALERFQKLAATQVDGGAEALSTFESVAGRLADGGASLEQVYAAIALEQGKVGESGKGVEAIAEAMVSLRQRTKPTIEAIQALGLDSDKVFQLFEKDGIAAVQLIAGEVTKLGPTSEATGLALADIFKGAGEDAGTAYLETLANTDLSLQSIIDSSSNAVQQQRALQEANEDLNQELNLLLGFTQGWESELKTLGKGALTSIIRGINSFIGVVKGAYTSIKEAVLASDTLQDAFAGIKSALSFLFSPFSFLIDLVTNFSATIAGLKAVASQVVDNVVNTFQNLVANLKIVGLEINKFFTFFDDEKEKDLQRDIDRLKRQKQEFGKAGKSVAEAYADAFNSVVAEQDVVKATEIKASQEKAIAANYRAAGVKAGKAFAEGAKSTSTSVNVQKVETSNYFNIDDAEEDAEELLKILKSEEAVLQAEVLANRLELQEFARLELRKDRALGLADEKEYQDKLLALKKAGIEAELLGLEEGTLLKLEKEVELEEVRHERLTVLREREVEAEKEAIEQEELLAEIKRASITNTLDAAESATTAIIQGFGEESKAAKVAIVIQKGIATAKNVINLQQQLSNIALAGSSLDAVLPGSGIAYRIINTGIALADFTGRQASILAFAKGGDVVGPGTGTSDSIPAYLSNGESVMTAKATSMFAPILSVMNQSVGGNPIGKGFAMGGLVMPRFAAGGTADRAQLQAAASAGVVSNPQIDYAKMAQSIAQEFRSLPAPVVTVEDINVGQNRVLVTENRASR